MPNHAPLHIVWFKRDLRTADHAPLTNAAAAATASGGKLLCLYVIEPKLWQQPDMAGRHWAFIAESLAALATDLQAAGQQLVVVVGDVTEVLEAYRQQHPNLTLYAHQENGTGFTYARDKAVAAWAASHTIPWHQAQPFGVWRGSKRISSRPGWAKAWEAFMRQPLLPASTQLPLPPVGLPPLIIPATLAWLAPDDCPHRQKGGRPAGIKVLHSFFSGRGARYHYQLSSPLTARKACSRWSPHLAYGTLSMREVVQRAYAEAAHPATPPESRRAYRALISRLHWHCHFIQKLEDEVSIEHQTLHAGLQGLRPTAMDAATAARFNAWATGQTGWPLVDATMAELNASGWITFRMRALLVSVATVHLWLPWQAVALHLARLFTDYESGIHYPQVQMQSGATGMNTVRAYNPTKQAQDQDPQGAHIRRWLPALANVPSPLIHTPWLLTAAEQTLYNCQLGTDYPRPLVDEATARKQGVAQLYQPRRTEPFKAVTEALVTRHSKRGGKTLNSSRPARPKKISPAAKPPLAELPLFGGV